MKGSVCLKNKKTSYLKSRYIYLTEHISITSIQFQYKFDNGKMAVLQISSQSYCWALPVLRNSQYQIHFKRIPDS